MYVKYIHILIFKRGVTFFHVRFFIHPFVPFDFDNGLKRKRWLEKGVKRWQGSYCASYRTLKFLLPFDLDVSYCTLESISCQRGCIAVGCQTLRMIKSRAGQTEKTGYAMRSHNRYQPLLAVESMDFRGGFARDVFCLSADRRHKQLLFPSRASFLFLGRKCKWNLSSFYQRKGFL